MPEPTFQTIPSSSDQAADLIGNSPLREATPDSIDELLARINEDILAGVPQRITGNDARLKKLIEIYRAQAVQWAIDESTPKERKPRAEKAPRFSVADLDI